MQTATVILVLAVGTGWLAFLLLQGLAGAAKTAREGFEKRSARRAERKRLALEEQRRKEDEANQQAQDGARKAEQEQIALFRQRHPAQIVGIPNLEAMRQTAKRLDDFIAAANCYRPKFLPPHDARFRTTQFSYPFEFFFPRSNSDDDGPPPETWSTTFNALQITAGRELRPIYTGLSEARHFPAKEPTISFDLPSAPQRPSVELPRWSIQVVLQEDGTDIENGGTVLAKAYAPEIAQANALRQNANAWKREIEAKNDASNEAQDLMKIYVANENLKFRESQQSISAEFKSFKKTI